MTVKTRRSQKKEAPVVAKEKGIGSKVVQVLEL
jgi:hypothetical protein